MTTLFITHPDCLAHYPSDGHPECAERLEAIEKRITPDAFPGLVFHDAPLADDADILRVHSLRHLEHIRTMVPTTGLNFIDGDTHLSPGSWQAALRAAGAVLLAVQEVMARNVTNAFCAVRPPGHHASRDRAEGFCLFNNIAIGAAAALERYGLQRVAIVDFDVHHGNGTQAIFWDEGRVLFASLHQEGIYPYSGTAEETGAHDNILNIPLPGRVAPEKLRELFHENIIPRLDAFRPEMLFVSAGFDAHLRDPIGGMSLNESDFAFMMRDLLDVARTHCDNRLVAVLEGGYNPHALAQSVAACVREMMKEPAL